MKWKKEHKMASMNAMPMHQMHPALAYGHHPMVSSFFSCKVLCPVFLHGRTFLFCSLRTTIVFLTDVIFCFPPVMYIFQPIINTDQNNSRSSCHHYIFFCFPPDQTLPPSLLFQPMTWLEPITESIFYSVIHQDNCGIIRGKLCCYFTIF